MSQPSLSASLADHPVYNYKVVRQFAVMTVVWGIVGMSVGVLLAAQLVWPALNFDLPWFSFGRLRPLHTNAVIFAFGGSALFATAFYVVQRTCQARLVSDAAASFVFWGWQAVIVLAAITLPLGMTSTKEYAELEWPIDVLLGVVWLVFAWLFFATVARRKTSHIYVANWFYGAFIIMIAMLHVVNSLAVPVTLTKSYSVYSGAVDAMVQWWYGHNAVGFYLTTGFLGMMYYFVPKQAERPVYSYRLSIVHFWALIGLYVWAGPHHLHYTALPDWVQSLGMAMSIVLLAPSWGGMINGMMTLSGAWHKLRTDPILRFLVVSLSFYGMSTFEGPMMSIKTVNSLSHYTDWTIGHVHAGALGWVAMISIGATYHLLPIMFGKKQMYSIRLINVHFWLSTIGTVLYIASMWVNGIMQGLMWRAYNTDGTLTYSFVQSVEASTPGYIVRLIGGGFFLFGMLLMAYNMWQTARARESEAVPAAQTVQGVRDEPRQRRKTHGADDRTDHRGTQLRRPGGDRAADVPAPDHRADRRPQAAQRAGAGGPRPLHPRGLRRLPLADGAGAALGNRALRPLLRRR
jgi:cytochrome c oxidase cbb3-type subunit 1